MSEDIRQKYERAPYDSRPQPQTHPRNLATLAFLRGIDTAPATRCRVLELGCNDGSNLIAMANDLPDSTFVGVDLVAPARKEANVELRAMSIMDVDASFGRFDFIICHGVYSWVPRDVQEKILAICRAHLAPDGIAYVSYNTYPGWHFRGMLRDLVRVHARGDAEEALQRSRDLVQFLLAVNHGSQHPYVGYLQNAATLLENAVSPGYFVHEYLESINEPLLFRDFAARASQHGLQYVCEADAASPDIDFFHPAVAEKLRSYSNDRIALEQYMDFMIDRTFRRTLLTHEESAVSSSIELPAIREMKVRTLPDGEWRSFAQVGMEERVVASQFVTGHVELSLY
ncbi:MAG TPA: class I SAM-dependent methyltransferase [Thermoanaerobaculia bacterium]|nr:class I SAM-dependent methyltransferase [Thermoanaerobaculia bacterium]